MTALAANLTRHSQLWLVLLCVCAFLLTYFSPVDASFSDPSRTLLTAQAIAEHGSVRLDRFAADERYLYDPMPPAANAHAYDYFPLGTSLLAVPAVWLALLRGEDMIYPEDNRALQNTLSSLAVVACTLLIAALCRLELSWPTTFALTLVFVFGSSIASTLGTALWSSACALVLGLGCLFLLARSDRFSLDRRDLGRKAEIVLGILVVLATLCRPTMALLLPVVALFLFRRRRLIPFAFGATVAAGLGLFVLFCWRETGLLLPPYYQPSRLGGGRFLQALTGHLLSPSRGILVLTPYLLLTLAGLSVWWRRWRRDWLAWLCLGWIGVHWLVVSSFPHWWGGWSFGNRLFLDVLPAQVLLTVRVARMAGRELSPGAHRLAAAAFLALGAFAIFVHTHQGLYNVYTVQWNRGIDGGGESRVFDWRRPQWLASPRSVGAHPREHVLLAGTAYVLGQPVLPTSEQVIFEGWSIPEGDGRWRWSNSRDPSLFFKTVGSLPDKGLALTIEAGTYQPQNVEVRLNGVAIGKLASARNWEPAVYELAVPVEVFAGARQPLPGTRIHRLDFRIPDAVLVGEAPRQRRLGLCLWRLTLRPAGP